MFRIPLKLFLLPPIRVTLSLLLLKVLLSSPLPLPPKIISPSPAFASCSAENNIAFAVGVVFASAAGGIFIAFASATKVLLLLMGVLLFPSLLLLGISLPPLLLLGILLPSWGYCCLRLCYWEYCCLRLCCCWEYCCRLCC